MALTELKHETQQAGAVNPTEGSLEVTVSAETSASPEQTPTAARDLSAHRAQIWPNVEANRLHTFAKAINQLSGRRPFGWFLRSALAAIEKTANTEPPIKTQTATP